MSLTRPRREPLFNAPAPVLALVAMILCGYALQSGPVGSEAAFQALALVPAQVAHGRLWELFTVLLVHGSWVHAGLNAIGLLAFGTPVARWFGTGRWLRFLGFYLACALVSSGGYVLVHWESGVALVGASGAISGMMGATSRLLDRRNALARQGALAPFRSRTVIAMAGAWLLINLLMALRWIDAGAGGAPIAWEAHLFGYAAGLLLIGPASGDLRRGLAGLGGR